MDLNEQAGQALDALLRDAGASLIHTEPENAARLMWLDGYRAGMEAVRAMAHTALKGVQTMRCVNCGATFTDGIEGGQHEVETRHRVEFAS